MDAQEDTLFQNIKDLIALGGADPESFDALLVAEIMRACLKMTKENYGTGQLKLMSRAFKEMRYAYRIFNAYPGGRKISIFGSARTPTHYAEYTAAKEFGSLMAESCWVCMAGAADGIMKAGLEGAKQESSFGLAIRLPFETASNSLLAGDPKLISFRYFFTRKLMFLTHSDAVAAFPGGVGTQDELFEVLTLMQTGKANIIPLVLVEGIGGHYWVDWHRYFQKQLLQNGWVCEEDEYFFYLAPSPEKAVEHILHFYRRYHSSRYVKENLVIRLLSSLTEEQVESLNQNFQRLLEGGKVFMTPPLEGETDHLELPRIAFHHNRRHFGLLRAMIDAINSFS